MRAVLAVALALAVSGCGAFLPSEPMGYGDCLWRSSRGIACDAGAMSDRGKGPVPAGLSLASSASATRRDTALVQAWPLQRLRVLHAIAAGGPFAIHRAGLALDKPGFFATGEVAEFLEVGFMEPDRRKHRMQPGKVSPPSAFASARKPASEARQLLVGNGAPQCGHVVNAPRCPHVHAEGSVIHIARAAASWSLT